MQDIDKYVQRAEKNCQRINLAGLYYCKGLQKRYEGDPTGALKELNWARLDNIYGRSAIMNMIEIYLNPANEMMYSSQGETGFTPSADNLAQARILIVELQARGVETTIIECNTHIASKDPKELSAAETKLKKILEKNSQYVPALVAIALCKFIQKKTSDAKTFLKSVTQQEFQLEYAEYFERAWLLSADYQIGQKKFDLAEIELKKVVQFNKSNVKAEELMGLIKEMDKDYIEAAAHYSKAFKMSNNKNANVGFRLAFNYLKANRYVDTIDVGKEILKVHPDYSAKLKTEIIDKARAMLRN